MAAAKNAGDFFPFRCAFAGKTEGLQKPAQPSASFKNPHDVLQLFIKHKQKGCVKNGICIFR
ncbi:MAG: hypothetical protein ACLSAP_10710 [Oscillospiraceae bacterium]